MGGTPRMCWGRFGPPCIWSRPTFPTNVDNTKVSCWTPCRCWESYGIPCIYCGPFGTPCIWSRPTFPTDEAAALSDTITLAEGCGCIHTFIRTLFYVLLIL